MKRRIAALALAVLLCLPLTACQKQPELRSLTWFDLFDTVTIVQGYTDSADDWNTQGLALVQDLERYNELFDIYNHYDDVVNLYDVNAQAAAAPVAVDDELYAFLRWCKDTVYPATDGTTNIAANAAPGGRRAALRPPTATGRRRQGAGRLSVFRAGTLRRGHTSSCSPSFKSVASCFLARW